MKFTIAAAILAQTIPEIASKQHSAKIVGQKFRFQDAKFLKNFKTFESVEGLLTNNRGHMGSFISCDPLFEDSDVGVLSCPSGYECVEEEASILGGFCMPTSRELEEPPIYCDICGYGKGIDWDIADDQPVLLPTGDEVTCAGLGVAAYSSDPIFSATTCPVFRSIAITAGCCFSYECPNICGDKQFQPYALIPIGDSTAYCLGVLPNIEAEDCASLEDDVAPYCCEDGATVPTGTSPGEAPSTAPILSPVVGETPASGAVWMCSTPTVVSAMVLAATITGFMSVI
jgi:hypothetical protein